ncbi:MAG: PASTA domain-containing protein [Actinomycetota bacterium]
MELGIDGLDRAYRIGSGASAEVYRARQIDLDRDVAVKILRATDNAFVQRFTEETRALGKLGQHPNVVTVYDSGVTDDGNPYLILELCRTTAAKRLEDGALKPAAACVAAAQVADGLAEAHANRIVHGDIRPENVLIGQTGRYVVSDFGLGPAATGKEPADDVYGLGAVLCHLATGEPPSGDADASRDRISGKNLPDIADLVADAMAPEPADRPTAAELRERLLVLASELRNEAAASTGESPASRTLSTQESTPSVLFGDDGDRVAEPSQTRPAGVLFSSVTKTGDVPAGGSAAGISIDRSPVMPPLVERWPRQTVGLALAAAGLLILVGGAAFTLIGRGGGQTVQNEEAVSVEAVEGPETTQAGARNEATPDAPGGAVGSLGSAAPGDENSVDGFDDTLPDTTIGRSATTVARVTLPNVVAVGADDAEAQLRTLGFAVVRVDEPTDTAPPGQVIGQDPVSGTRLTVGGTITLTVAIAPPVNNIIIPPEVVGQGLADATAILTAAGFTNLGQPITEPSSTVPAGLVIGTTPAAGSEVADTASVILVVSGGPAPDCASVVGLGEAAAEERFSDAGLTVTIGQTPHVTVPVGTVATCSVAGATATLSISTGPIPDLCAVAAGQQIAEFDARLRAAGYTVVTQSAVSTAPAGTITGCSATGIAVSLTFAALPAPQDCPTVVGLSEADARAAVLNAGFSDVSITLRSDETVPSGVVISCTPTGDTAKLIVSTGPEQTDLLLPNLVGQTEAAATTALAALGLQVATNVVADDAPAGTVVGSNPAAGTTVEPGDTVTLQISSGPATAVVPNVIGRRLARATDLLQAAGFVVTSRTEPVEDDDDRGRVLSSNPAAGTEAVEGSLVSLVVGA